jgi:hypothetical protein
MTEKIGYAYNKGFCTTGADGSRGSAVAASVGQWFGHDKQLWANCKSSSIFINLASVGRGRRK